ncbi:MAG TPA: Sec-independent protein translocase protein TatB [Vulgatibacter sp.]|nr:Sec-independent protein translocase protein TatB [Vulgatibacter sp.]
MFGLSFPELLVVMVVALVVLGPERLPKLAKTIGKAMREVRRTTGEFKEMVEGEFHALDREIKAMPEGKPDQQQAPAVPAVRPVDAVPAGPADESPAQGEAAAYGIAAAHAAPGHVEPAHGAVPTGAVAAPAPGPVEAAPADAARAPAPADTPAPLHTAETIPAGGAPASTKDA